MRTLRRILLSLAPMSSVLAIGLGIICFQLEKDLNAVMLVVNYDAAVIENNLQKQIAFNKETRKSLDDLEFLYDQTTLSNNENFVNLMDGKHAVNLRPVRFHLRRQIASQKPASQEVSKR